MKMSGVSSASTNESPPDVLSCEVLVLELFSVVSWFVSSLLML